MSQKTCFVVMGFGEKTDFATGRTLDLDKTYEYVIRPAVEEAGLSCVRADDVIHSGTIDAPMYRLLLEADVVVADLSTSNANAIYELGVRHALRPYTTIVIAEKQFRFPFDLGHLLIRPYEHLGKGIDYGEVERVKKDLTQAIRTLVATPDVDSPVYTFLPQLQTWNAADVPIVQAATRRPASPPGAGGPAVPLAAIAATPRAPEPEQTTSELLDAFRRARAASRWGQARELLRRLLERRPSDDYLEQQLALATYKAKEPDPLTALRSARAILADLHPHTSTDPETLGLWGAVHKRLWELEEDRSALDEAITAYEKGHALRGDPYNGINLAFLLNARAAVSPAREALADVVLAERTRRRVAATCEALLAAGIRREDGQPDAEQTFWVRASLVEALLGSGEEPRARRLRAEIAAEAPETWMLATLDEQLEKLTALLVARPEE